ncbi:membrane metallo-endopeptidase-like 1 [Stomoxys calcitrans]|uniref:membrane metallo-endopeptidase-like 1 n=1 Tax=Stomoxys calcitrans TaxID=35570 RepID=UPI0027E376C0|nr:membrane metallo-endopeptidase-like 1 [Stomoxys calcitrans]
MEQFVLSLLILHCACSPRTTSAIPKSLPLTIPVRDANYRFKYAQQMVSYMNLTVNPCEDFYEYACGNWKNTIPERHSESKRVNVLDIGFELNKIIEIILQKKAIVQLVPEYAEELKLARKFYENCRQTQLYPMRKTSKHLEILQKIGGFPAWDDKWNAAQFNWLTMSSHMSEFGIETLIKEDIFSEYPFMPYFLMPSFGFDIKLSYDNLHNKSSMAYLTNRQCMYEILTLYGIGANKSEMVLEKIFDFLAEVLVVVNGFKEDEYSCEKLSETLKPFEVDAIIQQWSQYFDIVWHGKFRNLTEDNRPCLYFYRELNKIVARHRDAVANYLSLKFLYHMDARLKNSKLQGDYCTWSVRNGMRFLFDNIFMKLFFNRQTAKDVKRMAIRIQKELRQSLLEATWMDAKTRKAALLKESSMKLYEVNRINLLLFENHIRRLHGLYSEQFNNQTKPLQMMLGMEVNAFYYPLDNSLHIAAGVLQPPTYHPAWPISLKYGTLGYILGHEFSHGFDVQGANYDYTGRNSYWWSEEASQQFEAQAQCFVQSYGNYCVPEINRRINGLLTLNENIADAGGLNLAFRAYRRLANEQSKKVGSPRQAHGKQETMPGLNLTAEQLFFVGAAQIWCSSYREMDYWQELTNTHTIEKYRVLGLMTNSRDFANTYNCPNKNGDKCEVW